MRRAQELLLVDPEHKRPSGPAPAPVRALPPQTASACLGGHLPSQHASWDACAQWAASPEGGCGGHGAPHAQRGGALVSGNEAAGSSCSCPRPPLSHPARLLGRAASAASLRALRRRSGDSCSCSEDEGTEGEDGAVADAGQASVRRGKHARTGSAEALGAQLFDLGCSGRGASAQSRPAEEGPEALIGADRGSSGSCGPRVVSDSSVGSLLSYSSSSCSSGGGARSGALPPALAQGAAPVAQGQGAGKPPLPRCVHMPSAAQLQPQRLHQGAPYPNVLCSVPEGGGESQALVQEAGGQQALDLLQQQQQQQLCQRHDQQFVQPLKRAGEGLRAKLRRTLNF